MKKKNIIASAMLALTMVFGMAGGMTVTPQLAEPVQAARRCNHNWRANCMLPSDVEEAGVKTYTQNEILKIANKLLADNRKNENADDVDKNPYAAGVHDGILDVLTNLKIDSKEKFLN